MLTLEVIILVYVWQDKTRLNHTLLHREMTALVHIFCEGDIKPTAEEVTGGTYIHLGRVVTPAYHKFLGHF